MNTNTYSSSGLSTSSKRNTSKPKFLGRLQPITSRLPQKPEVNFEKGGSDFRCPHDTSSLGKQVISYKTSSSTLKFPASDRFSKSDTIGPGPAALHPQSSLKHQIPSAKPSASNCNFGTSTRDGALKLYAIYTCKR